MDDLIRAYNGHLAGLLNTTQVTNSQAGEMTLAEGFRCATEAAVGAHDAGNKIMFVGNGGSAGIASHMSTDYSKNGGLRSTAFNDASALTCLGNDYGYEHVFAKQIEFHAREGDLLVAISSSGSSANILNAVEAARKSRCRVWTLSGFKPENPLRRSGDINMYVSSSEYGFVEISHMTLIHAVLDLHMGWDGAEH